MNTIMTSIPTVSPSNTTPYQAMQMSPAIESTMNSPGMQENRAQVEVVKSSENMSKPTLETISLECKESINVPFSPLSELDNDCVQATSNMATSSYLDVQIGIKRRKWSTSSAFVEVARSPHLGCSLT